DEAIAGRTFTTIDKTAARVRWAALDRRHPRPRDRGERPRWPTLTARPDAAMLWPVVTDQLRVVGVHHGLSRGGGVDDKGRRLSHL
ncbi:MAG: hypothetical protein ACRD0H_29525, partial [Actinomycetes bacterium]